MDYPNTCISQLISLTNVKKTRPVNNTHNVGLFLPGFTQLTNPEYWLKEKVLIGRQILGHLVFSCPLTNRSCTSFSSMQYPNPLLLPRSADSGVHTHESLNKNSRATSRNKVCMLGSFVTYFNCSVNRTYILNPWNGLVCPS